MTPVATLKRLSLIALAGGLAACVPPGTSDRSLFVHGGADAGRSDAAVDASVADSGAPARDSGSPQDSGTPAQDSGSPQDSGTPAHDSGSPQDSGTPAHDSGTPAQDAGTPDTGTPVDAGPGPDPSLSCDSQVYSGGSAAVCDTLFVGRHESDPSRRQLLDRCGNPFIFRGVEQAIYEARRYDNWEWLRLLSQELHMNAIRILPKDDWVNVSNEDLDALLDLFREEQMVVWISLSNGDDHGLHPEVREAWYRDRLSVLLKHQDHIVIDSMQELDEWTCDQPGQSDNRWLRMAKASVPAFRNMNSNGQYLRAPLKVMGDGAGRNIVCSFAHGAEVADLDPLKNILLGWQAYWTPYYQGANKVFGDPATLMQRVVDNDAFPIQVGLTTDDSREGYTYYREFMEDAETLPGRVGYLWWHYLLPAHEALRESGRGAYTSNGQAVLFDLPYAFTKQDNTKACFPD